MIRWFVRSDDSTDARWLEVIEFRPGVAAIRVAYEALGAKMAETNWSADPTGELVPVWERQEREIGMHLFQHHRITMKLKRAGTAVPAP